MAYTTKNDEASKPGDAPRYTCSDYRAEMLLASLRKRRSDPSTSDQDRKIAEMEIERLEREMGLS
ncbi:MAG: hypothetical protein HZB23_15150 [Deltaproteobacteria bacterium]|nr:hypothetical protein [Deltaproteobacteria bacterium]